MIGGLNLAREVRDLCISTGIKMRIDGPWCGDIASVAITSLALGPPEDLLIADCDLREPLAIETDLNGVVTAGPARIAPPPTGFDAQAVRGKLGPAVATYA